MDYTPPAGNNVNFIFSGSYTAPDGDSVDFIFGDIASITIHSISSNNIFDDALHTGFDRTVIKWSSSLTGSFRFEIGGTGAETGYLIESGNTFTDFIITTVITDSDIEACTSFSGSGPYQINIYVKSSDDVWTPHNYD